MRKARWILVLPIWWSVLPAAQAAEEPVETTPRLYEWDLIEDTHPLWVLAKAMDDVYPFRRDVIDPTLAFKLTTSPGWAMIPANSFASADGEAGHEVHGVMVDRVMLLADDAHLDQYADIRLDVAHVCPSVKAFERRFGKKNVSWPVLPVTDGGILIVSIVHRPWGEIQFEWDRNQCITNVRFAKKEIRGSFRHDEPLKQRSKQTER